MKSSPDCGDDGPVFEDPVPSDSPFQLSELVQFGSANELSDVP